MFKTYWYRIVICNLFSIGHRHLDITQDQKIVLREQNLLTNQKNINGHILQKRNLNRNIKVKEGRAFDIEITDLVLNN